MYNNLVVAHFCFIYSRSERHPPVGGGVVAPAVCANAFIIIFSAASSSPSSSSSSSSSLRSRGKVDDGRVRVRKLFQGHIFSSRTSLVPLLPLLLPWLLHHPPPRTARMHFDGSLILGFFFRILHPPPPHVPSRRRKRSSFQSRASARACTADAHASASTILCVCVCACVYFLPTRSDGTRFEYAIVHYVFVHLVLYIHAMCFFFVCMCVCCAIQCICHVCSLCTRGGGGSVGAVHTQSVM